MTSPQVQALANYADLVTKVDGTFGGIKAKAGSSMVCVAGCHQCCLPGLTINAVEAAALQNFIGERPALATELAALAAADPYNGTRCHMLDAGGLCKVYEARPIVCRSHGAPLEVCTPAGSKQKDVCPLNFAGESLATLPAGLILNLDLLNTLLTLIDSQYRGASAKEASPRTTLTLSALLPS